MQSESSHTTLSKPKSSILNVYESSRSMKRVYKVASVLNQ